MATKSFVVTGDQYRIIDRRMREIRRQLDQREGSPIDPDAVAGILQQIIEDRLLSVVNNIVHVDRSVSLIYPAWVDKVMNPELEKTGPTEYDLVTTSPWLHDDQKNGSAKGSVIYNYLKEHDLLPSCLGLADALAIQKMGAALFRKVFGNNVIYFWKSVVQNRSGGLSVPFLCVHGDEVVLDWYWLGLDWGVDGPAVRFASS